MAGTERTIVNTDQAPQPLGAYSQGIRVKAGELLYVAGQVGVDREGNLAGDGSLAAQTRQVYENIGAILAACGAGFSDVVEFTTYVAGRESVQPFMAARAEVFPSLYPNGDYPPNTLLVIEGLVREEFLVEIKAVAALP